jgi:hypothetical protein
LVFNNILYRYDLKTEIQEEKIEFKHMPKLFFFQTITAFTSTTHPPKGFLEKLTGHLVMVA